MAYKMISVKAKHARWLLPIMTKFWFLVPTQGRRSKTKRRPAQALKRVISSLCRKKH